MSDKENLMTKCLCIGKSHYLNAPYKERSIVEQYFPDGIANKATNISHYCTFDTLKQILEKQCLRFSDVRYLNDSTEFIEVLDWIKIVLNDDNYDEKYKSFILDSKEYQELKDYMQVYTQSYVQSKELLYRTYTLSVSTEGDLLNLWNYYSKSTGVNICFDHAWNVFEESSQTEINVYNILDNGIIISRGVVLYSFEDKYCCISKLLDDLYSIYIEAGDNLEEYKGWILRAFKQAINHMRCFFKNKRFVDEREYRFVLQIPEEMLLSDGNKSCIKEKGFFKRGDIFIPYIDYKINKESIKNIVINPYSNEKSDMIKSSIKDILKMNYYDGVSIFHSKIPIRKY